MKTWKHFSIVGILAIIAFAFAACPPESGESELPVHEHQWGAWTVTTAATCVAKGVETRVCVGDASHKETRDIDIDPDAHDWEDWGNAVITKQPTCTETGNGTIACRRKGCNKTDTEIGNVPALGHVWKAGDDMEIEPTCTENGVGTRICERCTITESHGVLAALGHDWKAGEDAHTLPTCTTIGYGSQMCTRCEETKPEGEIPALGHDYQNWIQTTVPTCTTAGMDTGTCTRDQVTTTRTGATINPNAHQWGNWAQTTAPNCTTTGIETRICLLNTAHTEPRTGVAALGHNYQWVTIAPSFIEEGRDKEICSRCSDENGNTRNIVSALSITTTQQWTTTISQLNGKTGSYTLTIGDNFNVAGSTANTFGATATGSTLTITLKGSGVVSLNSQGNLIRIAANQTLIIDSTNLTLQGLKNGQNNATQDNNNSVVFVVQNATLELRNGTISGNTSSGGSGGGVYVYGGTFTMSGGTIRDNSVYTNTYPSNADRIDYGGGGVFVSNSGTFNMSGGTISGNTTSASFNVPGGGVQINSGRFTMNGGTISGNNANGSNSMGGGVFVWRTGTFTMNNGTISGNTTGYGGGIAVFGTFNMNEGSISSNTATASSANGRGVYVSEGIFTMNGGTISGHQGIAVFLRNPATFRIVTGTVYGSNGPSGMANTGGALSVETGATAQRGTFSGETWNSMGNLSGSNNTIKVVNGVLQ